MECNLKANREKCTCTYEGCTRKGKCCECISFHRQAGEIPGCLFSPAAERTYDRSVASFIRDRRH
jgi:hypothetical protein